MTEGEVLKESRAFQGALAATMPGGGCMMVQVSRFVGVIGRL